MNLVRANWLTKVLSTGLALLLLQVPAGAEPANRTLTASEVLVSSGQHFPSILRSLAELQATESELLTAKGAFDTVFSADGYSRARGFYDGDVAGARLSQPFRALGGSVYGQYRQSGGEFPIYEDELYTSDDGQLKLGVVFSLLRNRGTDERRFAITDATLNIQEAELDVLLVRIGVQQRALRAYWRWVAAGRKLSVYNELLELALDRDAGLQRQVRDGSRAEIFLTENGQNITRRRSLALSADRDFRIAAFNLSYYYRDSSGAIVMPSVDQLPALPVPEDPIDADIDTVAIESLLAHRPELQVLETAIKRAANRINLARNDMQPALDVTVDYSAGMGEAGPGGPSKNSEDVVLGVTFSVPIAQRQARGRLDKALAERDGLQFERQLTRDRLELEVQNIVLDLEVARELASLAELEVEQAQTMRNAEVKRFAQGASDFFLVNLREEAAANALIRWYAAKREARIARANYDAATVNLDRLGLDN